MTSNVLFESVLVRTNKLKYVSKLEYKTLEKKIPPNSCELGF